MTDDRVDRNIRFFGKAGQERLRAATVAIVGCGGVGTHVAQQLALLGVGGMNLIDKEEADDTNRNRYVGLCHDDPVPGTLKVVTAARMIRLIDPSIRVQQVPKNLLSQEAFEAVIGSDYVFGCVDKEGVRLVLNELCAAYRKPYIDVSSEIMPGPPPVYGGCVCVSWDGNGCIVCLAELDTDEAKSDLMPQPARADRDKIYGIGKGSLGQVGPSVVSINGVVASLATTEFMLAVTGMREPKRLLRYRGHMGGVSVGTEAPQSDCYYCKGIRGKGRAADVQRYLSVGLDL